MAFYFDDYDVIFTFLILLPHAQIVLCFNLIICERHTGQIFTSAFNYEHSFYLH